MISKESFVSYVEPVTESGCWVWMGKMNDNGYGRLWDSAAKKEWGAHRLSYTLFNGSIPSDKWVLHRCDVPCCVNPNHLFLGTNQDNTKDREKKGRGAKGKKHGMYGKSAKRGVDNNKTKLTEENVRLIRENTLSLPKLAKLLGVSVTAIWYVRTGRNWKHI